jgi:hypothetical protein
LADRVELALRARKRRDLADAMEGLPPVWEDLPVGVHTAAHHVRRGVRRAHLFFRFVRVWFKVNLALVLAFGLAGGWCHVGRTLGAAAAAWVLASFASGLSGVAQQSRRPLASLRDGDRPSNSSRA